MKKTFMKTLMGSTIIAGSILAAGGVASAQTADEDEADSEVIVVTGSRIKRDANMTSSIPVATIGAIDLENTSAFNAAEIIRDLPQSGVPGLTGTTTNFSVFSAGLESVDLRNLGDARTLTLMDGRRLVPGVPGSSVVDFSMIPPDFIERIEVVTGGASSVYGSEAIAGVVNVILKDDFEGVEFNARIGDTEKTGGFDTRMGVTAGSQFDNDKGNVLFNFTVDTREGIRATDTPYSTDTFAFSGFDVVVEPLFSTYAESGRYSVDGAGDTTILADGTVVPFTRDLGFNRQENRRLSIPQKRYSGALKSEYEINDFVNMSTSLLYAHVSSDSDIEPFPNDSDSIYNPNGTVAAADVGIPITNPLIPDDIRALMIANGDERLEFARRMTEVSDREGRYDRTTIDFSVGFDGPISVFGENDGFLDNMSYETYANYGRSTSVRNGAGQVNVQNMRFALDAIVDPNNPNNVICRDATARAFGCVPANIFGAGNISEDAAAYIAAPGVRNAETEQFVLNGSIAGDLFNAPAGPVGFAVGAEYREIESADIVDALTSAGLNAGNAIDSTIGAFDVVELFTEVLVPVVKDMGILDDVNFEGAYRTSDYSTAGRNDSWKLGLTSSMFDSQLRFRAVQSKASRAPNIGDLFSGNSQSFSGTIDPCAGVGPADVGATDARTQACLALPGVQAAINNNEAFFYTDLDTQSQYFFNSGSPLLESEDSDSTTIGFVFEPTFWAPLEGFTGSIDYVDFEITNAITNFSRNESARICLDAGNNPNNQFCQNIVRDPNTSKILFSFQRPINAAVFKTDAVDLQLAYRNDVPFVEDDSQFDVKLLWSRTLNFSTQDDPADPVFDEVGNLGQPEDRVNFQANYYNGPFSLNWRTTYLSKQEIDEDSGCDQATIDFVTGFFPPSGGFCYSPGSPDWMEHGVTARYEIEDLGMSLYGGVDNLTDEFIYIPGGFNGNVTGTETNGAIFDAAGRRYFVGLKKKW